MKILKTLASTSILFAAASTSHAATVSLANADFDAATPGAAIAIAGWDEFEAGATAADPNYAIDNAGLTPSFVFTENGGATTGTDVFGAIKGTAGAWIGQGLSASDAGAMDATTFSDFTINFLLGTRVDAGQYSRAESAGTLTELRVSLWNTATNAELAGQSIIIADPGFGAVGADTDLTTQVVNLSYDNAAQTAGDTLQFRVTNVGPDLGGALWQRTSIVDDFTITAVPEPGAAALFGLGGLLMIMRRRRK